MDVADGNANKAVYQDRKLPRPTNDKGPAWIKAGPKPEVRVVSYIPVSQTLSE